MDENDKFRQQHIGAPTDTDTPAVEPIDAPTDTDTPAVEPIDAPTDTDTPAVEPIDAPTDMAEPAVEPIDAPTDTAAPAPASSSVYKVKISHSNASDMYVCALGETLEHGDAVIVPTRYGKELGRIQGVSRHCQQNPKELPRIERKASKDDLHRFHDYMSKEQEAFDICRQKIADQDLNMKLVSAHYMIDETKILFYFTAESRVDFRELVKDLVSVFKTRIELRQIGVRDEARVLGGIGVCGRDFCCHGVTDKLRPVSIKMAKVQNLTLNSLKISGPCGRLLCCLAYEYDTYRELKKELPSEGSRIHIGENRYKIVDVNIFAEHVRMESSAGKSLEVDFEYLHYDRGRQKWQVREGFDAAREEN